MKLTEHIKNQLNLTEVTLTFEGPFLPNEIDQIDQVRGIYVAFVRRKVNKLKIPVLIYIGKADRTNNVRKRIDDHINDRDASDSGKQSWWEQEFCKDGETIEYAFAPYDGDLDSIESALIYENYSQANDHHQFHYNGSIRPLRIVCNGVECGLRREIEIK